ncbi:MAG: hypothetical protein IV104_04470 [Acidovorax sp.]|nr:hypothetical protein [Acidovorax sp.]
MDMQERKEYPPIATHRQSSKGGPGQGFIQGCNTHHLGSATGYEDVFGPMKKGGLRRLFLSNGLQADDYSE